MTIQQSRPRIPTGTSKGDVVFSTDRRVNPKNKQTKAHKHKGKNKKPYDAIAREVHGIFNYELPALKRQCARR